MNRVNVPKLRFKGFEGKWKQDVFGKYVIHSAFGPRFSSDLYGNQGNIATLRTTDMDLEGNICYETMPLANLEFDQIKDHILEANDIVISRSGTIGITGVFKNYKIKVVPGAFLIRFRVDNQKISTDFIKLQFNSTKGRNSLNTLSAGGVQKNLTGTSVKQLEIVIPTLPEQQKIASFLSAVDEKIQQLSRKKELLEQYKKGLMQQLFSGKLRFKDENGNDYADWIDFKIGDLDFYISDGNYGELYPKASEMKSSGIPFIRANNIKNLKLTWKDMKYIEPEHHKILDSGHLKTGDILVTTRGDIGMLAYVEEDFDNANINAQICLIRSPDNLISKYILQFLASDFGLKQFKSLQTGTALKQLPKGNLNKIIIPVPSYEEQQKIANLLSSIDAKIESTNQQINQTQSFKKGLLQQMFV
jgi:type I restriction enzyme S subunit